MNTVIFAGLSSVNTFHEIRFENIASIEESLSQITSFRRVRSFLPAGERIREQSLDPRQKKGARAQTL